MKKVMIILTIAALSGCGTFDGIDYDKSAGVAKVSNAERTFVVDYGATPPIKRCLEAPGPAALLNDSNFTTTLKGGNESVTDAELSLISKNTESIAKMYEVSSILQYTHAMSYRLCEAALNGYMTGPQYIEKIDALMASTKQLLEIQLEASKAETAKVEAEVELEKAKALNK
ncbi:hypothetical protein A9Q99_24845 [Gammaproteobacteria bacterium 45_16_T64]|nr:hypothetical protein A9Q99_24845 [Gammaproteobacteria bacterium 45_16_T64]